MTKIQLKKALAKKGIFSIEEFARKIGMKGQNVHKAFLDPEKNRTAMERIKEGLSEL